jgi:hypothetical protein
VCAALSEVSPPFNPGGGFSVLEKRDQENALLQYRLRCMEEDKQSLQQQLRCVRRQFRER